MIQNLLIRLFWHFFWAGTLFHHGKTGQQKVAENQTGPSEQTSAADTAQQGKLTGAAQGTLGQFEGPVQKSPFYKSLLTSGIQDTSRAYDTARSNMRQQANQAGFGYNQPVAQGADNQLQAQEASSLASIPQRAMQAAAPLSLQAAQQTGGMGMGYGTQGLGWDQAAQNWNQGAYGMQKGRAGLWNQLLGMGQQAGTGLGEAALLAP